MMLGKIRWTIIEDFGFDKIGELTVSIGVTWFKGESNSSEQFVKRADQSCISQKKSAGTK